MAPTIRSVRVDDAAALQAIYAPYVANTIISFESTPPSADEMAMRIEKTISKYPWLVCTVSEAKRANEQAVAQNGSGATLAGYAYASSHRERSAYQWSVDVSVYVSPAYQRRNIGRGLYTALFALLRAQGYINAYAGIALPNPASVGVHTALGFEPVGVYRQVGYKLGGWHDVGWWCLRLTHPASKPLPPKAISDLIDTAVMVDATQAGEALIRG